MLHKTKAAVIAATVAMGVTLFGYLSYAAGGTYFTYVDNANNTNNLISPANSNSNTTPDNDMATNDLANMTETSGPSATYGNGATIEFNINNTGTAPTTSVSLTVRAWDVDEEQGEIDNVYLNGNLLGKLTGANDVWSTTVYNISNLSWVTTGNNLVQIKPDVNNAGWVTGARWGQILIDGGAADKASTGAVTITGCQTRTANTVGCTVNGSVAAGAVQIDTQATINAVTAGNYRLEVTIIDPNGNSTSVLTDNFTATANSTITRTVSPTYTLSSATGTYTVQSQLFYIDSNSFPVQQDIATRQFQHIANQGPTDLDNDGLTNTQETTLGTSPTIADTDGDGIADNTEVGGNVNAPLDTDGDGIINALESNTVDTDGDGLVDAQDIDSDGDGILDSAERGAGPAPADTDGDGLPDYRDLDTDNDGIPDVTEAGLVDVNRDGKLDNGSPTTASPRNTDGDALADFRDLDDDADTLLDTSEAGGIDANHDGRIDGFVDTNHNGLADSVEPGLGGTPLPLPNTDGDANPNYIDTDSDGDGVLDASEPSLAAVTNACVPNANSAACLALDSDGDGLTNGQEDALGLNRNSTDTDGDGIADNVEVGDNVNAPLDTDGDGIINALESATTDTDGDGVLNSADADSDNDGIPDSVEKGANPSAPVDSDADGIPDYLDRDSDNDGIPDALEAGATPATPVDTDGDGKKDYLDLDSDNDGLPDTLEGDASGVDTDGDQVDDVYDADAIIGSLDANHDGVADGKSPPDTDHDGKADFRDIDSDNDGILDTAEANVSGLDSDGDGIDNTLDTDVTHGVDANGDHIDDAYVLPDRDGDNVPDFRDLDTDNDGILDVTEAGLADTNGDGQLDAGGTPTSTPRDTDNDGLGDFREVDSNNDGTFDIAATSYAAADANHDGRIDAVTDTDGDGIANVADRAPNLFGASVDTDGDGIGDSADLDDDNDGIPDTQEGSGDFDGDGVINSLDRDSDNDGLTDTVEAGGVDANHDGVIDNFVDVNGNGLSDSVEVALAGTALPLPDTDNDGNKNFLDLDSDADGLSDNLESNGVDANNDGLVDTTIDSDGDGLMDSVDGSINGSVAVVPVDSDADGQSDYMDVDSDNDGVVDSREGRADSDGDGIPDYRDQPGRLETALRGAGAFDSWFVLGLAGLLALRMPRVRRALVTMLLVASGSANAATAADHKGEWYVGGDVGLSWLEPRNVDGGYRIDDKTSTGYRLLVGNQVFNDWSVEGFYIDTGKAGVSSDNPNVGHLGDVKYTLYGVGTEWTPLFTGRAATFYPLLKAGLVSTKNSTNSQYIHYDKLHSVGLYFGAAGVWQFARTWRAQLEATSYDKDELMVTLGLRKTFGGRRPATVGSSAPAPQVAPAVVTAAAPVVAPASVTPPPAPPTDSDHDGVIDSADQCPMTPANDKVDSNGCSLSIRLQVYFDNDSGKLKPASYADLERVIEFMKLVPTAAGELQGHTDNVGKESYNLSLSQKRADSVKAFMISKGVAAERLTTKGYGESQPIASNDTPEGRAENRRVLFVRTDVK